MASRKLEVVIAGDAKNLRGALDDSEGALGRFGGALGNVSKIAIGAFAAIGVGAVAAGAGLLSIASGFDDAVDSIATMTGAAGAELDKLNDSFERVFTSVPTSMDAAADAVGRVSQRFAVDGELLDGMSMKFLELSRLTGVDLTASIDSASRVMGDWGQNAEDFNGDLDAMFRATQVTGIEFGQLSDTLVQFGAPLRQLGFGFEESIALISKFEAEGVNTELVLGSMRQALGRMARAGEEPIETFRRVTEQIAAAGSAGEANALALELFGARAGPDMAAAIREGRFNIEEMLSVISDGESTILGTGRATADFGEKFTILKNKLLVAIRPIAEKVFDALNRAMDRIIPVVEHVMAVFDERGFAGVMDLVKAKIIESWPAIREALGRIAQGVLDWVAETAPKVGRQLLEWGKQFVEWVVPQIPPALRELGKLAGKLGEWLLDEGLPLLAEKLKEWGIAFVKWVGPLIGPLLVELGKMNGQLLAWMVTDALPKILQKIGEWGAAFVKWVATDAAPKLLEELGKLLLRLGEWIATDGRRKLADLGISMAGWILEGLGRLGTRAVEWLKGLPGELLNAVLGLVDKFAEVGVQIAKGILRGLKEKLTKGSISIGGQTISWNFSNFGPLHTGGTFRAPTPGGTGLALLRDGEEVTVPAHAGGRGGGDLVLMVGAYELGRVALAALQDVNRAQGPLPLSVRGAA